MSERIKQYYLVEENQKLRNEIERLKQALNSLLEVEESECRFDHHGHCQSHYLDPATEGCRVAKARKLL